MQSIPKTSPICPVCNGILDVIPYSDIFTEEKGFIAQCQNKCHNLKIKDVDYQSVISKFQAISNYLKS